MRVVFWPRRANRSMCGPVGYTLADANPLTDALAPAVLAATRHAAAREPRDVVALHLTSCEFVASTS